MFQEKKGQNNHYSQEKNSFVKDFTALRKHSQGFVFVEDNLSFNRVKVYRAIIKIKLFI